MIVTVRAEISEETTLDSFEYIIEMMEELGFKSVTVDIDGDPMKEVLLCKE